MVARAVKVRPAEDMASCHYKVPQNSSRDHQADRISDCRRPMAQRLNHEQSCGSEEWIDTKDIPFRKSTTLSHARKLLRQLPFNNNHHRDSTNDCRPGLLEQGRMAAGRAAGRGTGTRASNAKEAKRHKKRFY